MSTFFRRNFITSFRKKNLLRFKKYFDPKKSTRIFIFGDSNSIRSSKKMACWPSLLYEKAPSKLSVHNESCYGRTTQFDVGELNGLNSFFNKVKKPAFFDYVIFMLGTNDVKTQYGPPSVKKVIEGMASIIDMAISSRITDSIVLLTPPPMGKTVSDEFMPGYLMIQQVSEAYAELAKNRHLILIDLYNNLDSHKHLEKDNIHLNASGRRHVADIVWESVHEDMVSITKQH